jgi:hypothetical protein
MPQNYAEGGFTCKGKKEIPANRQGRQERQEKNAD